MKSNESGDFPTSYKILDLERCVAIRKKWAARNLRVVFTNGVFDLLHPGHVQLLESARRLGDRMIVGINTDASARRLGKGPDRPLNKLKDRQAVIAALECVDAVVSFGDDTPEQILSKILPDVLVKGGDYKLTRIAGRQYAGKTATFPLKKGYSTTSLAARIRRAP